MKLSFVVLGKAQPGGSKKGRAIYKGGEFTGKVAVSDANDNAKSWQQEVRHAANEARVEAGGIPWVDPLSGPVGINIKFYRARLAGHYGTGRNAGVLKASAPAYPTTAPDIDKLTRCVLDALSGCLYRNDAQVVVKDARKFWGHPERVEIEIWAIEP